LSDTDIFFFPLNRTSINLKQPQNYETCINREKLDINKQFENAIEAYNKTKMRKKVVGYVSIPD